METVVATGAFGVARIADGITLTVPETRAKHVSEAMTIDVSNEIATWLEAAVAVAS